MVLTGLAVSKKRRQSPGFNEGSKRLDKRTTLAPSEPVWGGLADCKMIVAPRPSWFSSMRNRKPVRASSPLVRPSLALAQETTARGHNGCRKGYDSLPKGSIMPGGVVTPDGLMTNVRVLDSPDSA
jgi:hypothetical protein